MSDFRLKKHPILNQRRTPATVPFTFNGDIYFARPGEPVSSALYAAGISVLGHHYKDGGPQGIFCVNGQCSQCNVIVNGALAKSCMTIVEPGMEVKSCEGLPPLPDDNLVHSFEEIPEINTTVLVIGGGPAGICACIELGKLGVDCIMVDDKPELGGKLSLQTHNFFGNVKDCWAGTRGIDIGFKLERDVRNLSTIDIWLNSTAVGVYYDHKVGIITPEGYKLVNPKVILIATGAREKSLSFVGSSLPGVYGAGAFQTLVNRDLIKAAKRILVVGGGNVGLIGAYHALQAGIDVVGLVEALPQCGGYKVHEDKLRRFGVPVWTSHSIVNAQGYERVEKVTIAQIDKDFQPIPGTEKTFEVDTILIAVGLAPVNELYEKAKLYNMPVYSAGDADEIAEASAAIFSGKITGRKIAQDLGIEVEIPEDWVPLSEILRSKPGKVEVFAIADRKERVFPIIRCVQEIPCNPCSVVCPKSLIKVEPGIMELPKYTEDCLGCGRCVTICPGLAIVLVFNDYDPKGEKSLIMMPFEYDPAVAPPGSMMVTVDLTGNTVGHGKVIAYKKRPEQDRRLLLLLEVPAEDKLKVAGFRVREEAEVIAAGQIDDYDPIVCRCERVRKSAIVAEIKSGVRDINQLKVIARNSMGGCGGKTCVDLVMRIFRELGVNPTEVTQPTNRPLVAEIPLGKFAGEKK